MARPNLQCRRQNHEQMVNLACPTSEQAKREEDRLRKKNRYLFHT